MCNVGLWDLRAHVRTSVGVCVRDGRPANACVSTCVKEWDDRVVSACVCVSVGQQDCECVCEHVRVHACVNMCASVG